MLFFRMKQIAINKSVGERLIYWGLCIISMGAVFVARLIVSEAIRRCFEEKENEN